MRMRGIQQLGKHVLRTSVRRAEFVASTLHLTLESLARATYMCTTLDHCLVWHGDTLSIRSSISYRYVRTVMPCFISVRHRCLLLSFVRTFELRAMTPNQSLEPTAGRYVVHV